MPSCVIKTCKNHSGYVKKHQGITFHKFPSANEVWKNDWIRIIRECRNEKDWNPSKSSVICSKHFETSDLYTTETGLRRVFTYSVPTKFLFEPSRNRKEQPSETSECCESQEVSSINVGGATQIHQSTSEQNTISSQSQVPKLEEKFKFTGYCRLCASSNCDGDLINLRHETTIKELVMNMTNRLNTKIDFSQEHLPTTICNACLKILYTTYDFVAGIDLAQKTLNNLLMQKYINQMPEHDIDMDLPSTSTQQLLITNKAVHYKLPSSLELESKTTLNQQSPHMNIVETEIHPTLKIEPSNMFIADLNVTTPISPELNKSRPYQKKIALIQGQKRKIKTLNQKIRRLQDRNKTLKDTLKELKEKGFIESDLFKNPNENMLAADLFNILNRKILKKNIIYSKAIRKFCLKLNYYSPRAYDYIRQSFYACLPHRKTLGKWCGHNNVKPQFTEESFKALEANAEVSQNQLEQPCNVDDDDMNNDNIM